MKQVIFALALLAAATPGPTAAASLVANGGLETGDFSGWTLSDIPPGEQFSRQVSGAFGIAHSGSHAAVLGTITVTAAIEQAIATTSGHRYAVSFWLANRGVDFQVDNYFEASFGDTSIARLVDVAPFDWSMTSAIVTATEASTVLRFASQDVPNYWTLDDIAVEDLGAVGGVPEPATWALLIGGFAMVGTASRRQRAARSDTSRAKLLGQAWRWLSLNP